MDGHAKGEALKRLSIAHGHLGKVKQMIENEDYCPDVIHQSRAVQAALKKVDEIILHGHLHSCVLKDIHSSDGKSEELVDEIVGLFSKE